VRRVARMGESRNVYKIVVRKPEGRHRHTKVYPKVSGPSR